MTDDEKENHPECYNIGGYNKIILVTTEDKQKWWDSLSDVDKNTVCSLPNFDKSKFKECLKNVQELKFNSLSADYKKNLPFYLKHV